MRRALRMSLLAPVAVALVASAGCSGEDEAGAVTTDQVAVLDATFMPDELLGLAVEPEATEGLADVTRSYVDAIRLHSLRDGDQLVATLQVGRFAPGVEWDDRRFQRGVLNQIGANAPDPVRLGDHIVFVTTGVKQRLAVWFTDGYFFVLGVRDEFDRPRTLLRAALEVTP